MKPAQHNSCTQVRRMKISHGSLNMATGVITPDREEWKTQPCGAPLFGDEARKRGTCKSCHEGWTHPDNYPVQQ